MRSCELKISHYDRVENCFVPVLSLETSQPFSREELAMEKSKSKAQVSKLCCVSNFVLEKKKKGKKSKINFK